jgi:Na+/alanine symporter
MQCSMRNQCSGLFICIMNYLHVLCMILMVLNCVLCMTLIVFIDVYYGLFACTNLVDVMPLFSQFFVPFINFQQNSPGNRHADF